MRKRSFQTAVLSLTAIWCVTRPVWGQPALTTLYTFYGPHGGNPPLGGVTLGPGGVLYGTTWNGGTKGEGGVFSLTPPSSAGGSWTETELYDFTTKSAGFPTGVLVRAVAPSGRTVLFGTTTGLYENGGRVAVNGVAFALISPSTPGGAWTESNLYNFGTSKFIYDTLAMDAHGVLYGTTEYGGSSQQGIVFSLTPPSSPDGAWTETLLYDFATSGGSAFNPGAGVVIGAGGVLYGTTLGGGHGGTIFSLTPPTSSNAAWTEATIYGFSGGSDGLEPAGVVMGPGGVLYGMTTMGGTSNNGVVFSLTPPNSAGGAWSYANLHSFGGGAGDGSGPYNTESLLLGPLLGGQPILYGTTAYGGPDNSGTIFALTPPASSGGAWTEKVLYSFTGGSDGKNPNCTLILGPQHVLYGTTANGFNVFSFKL